MTSAAPALRRPHGQRRPPLPSAERSAARLAHQSGGLGVPSSNLGAPTKSNHPLFSSVGSGDDYVLAGGGECYVSGGSGHDQLYRDNTGAAFGAADILKGGSGNDLLVGQAHYK